MLDYGGSPRCWAEIATKAGWWSRPSRIRPRAPPMEYAVKGYRTLKHAFTRAGFTIDE